MTKSFSKVYEALNWASSFLKESGREGEAATVLLCYRLGFTRSELYLNMRESFPQEKVELFVTDVERHVSGTPVQYITGFEEFYGRKFQVNNDVLIPRPETEELIEGVIKRLPSNKDHLRIVDVGTGSGIIAVTMTLEVEEAEVSAVDLSPKALRVAKDNAQKLGANVDFYEGSFLEPLIKVGKHVDVVISNPPYIPRAEVETLSDIVKDQEPRLALEGGEDGLSCYRDIVSQLPQVVASSAFVAFEIGSGQGKDLRSIISSAFPNAKIEIEFDINGKERMVFALLNN
ncbi:peptide chain release factor N(5)-glutamine methyltransferase [Bacillus solimangrovi]|uniref:Release factor glutamine methyltransferase n=1 Tax=Bacillus solimangrovi TaxID=1305675 RepID=A0A1E5LGU2_9BACI|nr:peptide chain release factor N(5)-glutamine methyltransferase [Bacillus solimangrovi]OEH93299.1 protein-(glutamine-N5) methyltransferase, release factor-specific [Bacillus solimangrovi]